jgi:HNH endonuclease
VSRRQPNAKEKIHALLSIALCPRCGTPLITGDVQWDHIQALGRGGSNEIGNWQPLHVECHLEKTRVDIREIAKTKRLEKKNRLDTIELPMEAPPLRIKPKRKIQSRGFQKGGNVKLKQAWPSRLVPLRDDSSVLDLDGLS